MHLSDNEDEYVSEPEVEEPRSPVADPEEWQDYHSEFLVTLWHMLVDEVASMGVCVLDRCTFHDFAEFCFRRSSGHRPPC